MLILKLYPNYKIQQNTTKMKLRLLLTFFTFLFLSNLVFPQSGVVFYSKAPMYVVFPTGKTDGSTTESTVLHIEGSTEFSTKSVIKLKGRMQLTGDFINDKTSIASLGGGQPGYFEDGLLFDKSIQTNKNEGVVAFVGKNIKQLIKRSDRLTRNLSDEEVEDETQKNWYYLNFPTIRVEQVTENPFYTWDNGVSKAPNVDPRKYNYLAVDSSAAMMVDHLVVLDNNRFAVEGGYSKFIPRELNVGQALIKQAYFTNGEGVEVEDKASLRDDEITGNGAFYSQVNLSLYEYKAKDGSGLGGVNDNVFGTDHSNDFGNNTMRNALGDNYMTGFTPPFRQLGADYFFYHLLTQPSQKSFNSTGGNILDPYTRLLPGKGYFMSMDVSDFDHLDNINPRWEHDMGEDIGNQHRARGGFIFNRGMIADYLYPGYSPDENQKGFSRFTYPGSLLKDPVTKDPELEKRDRKDMMTGERFNLDDVIVDLEEGFNFLGNPFMAPINLNALMGMIQLYPGDGTEYDFRPIAGAGTPDYKAFLDGFDISTFFSPTQAPGDLVYASAQNSDKSKNMLRTKIWFINEATARYHSEDGLFHYKATYDYRSATSAGSFYDSRYDPSIQKSGNNPKAAGDIGVQPSQGVLIAPMQMFGVQANNSFSIRLDKRMRDFGYTDYRKTSNADKNQKAYENSMKDAIIVELVSPFEKSSDRTVVVLRKDAKASYLGDFHDTRKGISKAMETYQDIVLSDGKNRAYPAASTSLIYTKSTDGESLLGNGLPMNTKEVPLYVTPPASQQTMTMNFYNLDYFTSVPNVWLIDRYENKTIKIEKGTSYQFASGPSDLEDKNNRFILRFWGEDDEVVKEEDNVTCYYNTSVLHVAGLTEADLNSTLTIYDMQGRLLGKTRITDAPSMEYLKPLSLGTYIVKIEGARNFALKFVNLSR